MSWFHLPGEGESVGAALVNHERLAGIVFTGSRAVGTQIIESAGKRLYQNRLYGDTYPVKVIAEMGGKNAIIVTDNAELDETVAGILASAFGHAGQKCSAASRVIVHNNVKSRLTERLQAAINDLTVAPSDDFNCLINPLITMQDRNRLRRQVIEAVAEAKQHGGRVVVDRSNEEFPGWCLGPVLIELSAKRSTHPDSYAQKELFGPVLHLIEVDSLDEALRIYNATEYALTGGIFSQSQDDIDYLSAHMESGNIYVNRNITGARVAVEPFGGFKFSGTGPKAGHKSYLRAFHRNAMEKIAPNNYENSNEMNPSQHFELCLTGDSKGNFNQMLQSMSEHLSLPYREQFSTILSQRQDNRKIPGQLSYNDWSLRDLSVLFISASCEVTHAGILQIVSAASMGASISMACLNQDIYSRWLSIVQHFHNAGWDSRSINAFLTTEQASQKHFKNPAISVIILEGSQEFVQTMLHHIYSGTIEGGIKTVLTSVDVPVTPKELDSLLEKFTHLRSFAVNTVRYGAPFELPQ